MKVRKLSSALLATSLALTAILAGCSGKGEDGNKGAASPSPTSSAASPSASQPASEEAAPDIWQVGSEPLEFSVYHHYGWSDAPEWESTPFGRYAKEKLQVTMTPIKASGNHEQKLTTMIADGKLPDVIWGDRGANVERLREAGMLVPLDDYVEKYPNLKKWLNSEVLNMLRSPADGKLYMFPNWYNDEPFGNAGYLVNKKIYDELGAPSLETTDDLYDYLKKVKEKYKDVIPFEPHLAKDLHGIGLLYTAFEENALYWYLGNQMRAIPRGDKLTSVLTDPAFRESQKYVAKLYREGLMAQDAMTQTLDNIKEKVTSGRVAVYAASSPTENGMLAQIELEKQGHPGYFMTWPIHKAGLDRNKIFPGSYSTLGWNAAVITTSAKDPEKVFAFLDWMTGSEGHAILHYGPEGEMWQGFDDEGYPNFTDKLDVKKAAEIEAENQDVWWVGNAKLNDRGKIKAQGQLPPEEQSWISKVQSEVSWKTQADHTEFSNLTPDPDSPEGYARQAVDDIFNEVLARTLTAKNDAEVDQILDKAQKDAEAAGYDMLLEWKTEQWHKNKEIMAGKFSQ